MCFKAEEKLWHENNNKMASTNNNVCIHFSNRSFSLCLSLYTRTQARLRSPSKTSILSPTIYGRMDVAAAVARLLCAPNACWQQNNSQQLEESLNKWIAFERRPIRNSKYNLFPFEKESNFYHINTNAHTHQHILIHISFENESIWVGCGFDALHMVEDSLESLICNFSCDIIKYFIYILMAERLQIAHTGKMENRRIDVYRNGSDARSLARAYARAIEIAGGGKATEFKSCEIAFYFVRTSIHNSISIETKDRSVCSHVLYIFNCAEFDYNCQKSWFGCRQKRENRTKKYDAFFK